MTNKLVFFATHRLHWMREMDTYLVIENGKIVESGTHQELLQEKALIFNSLMLRKEESLDEALSKIYFSLFKTISKFDIG